MGRGDPQRGNGGTPWHGESTPQYRGSPPRIAGDWTPLRQGRNLPPPPHRQTKGSEHPLPHGTAPRALPHSPAWHPKTLGLSTPWARGGPPALLWVRYNPATPPASFPHPPESRPPPMCPNHGPESAAAFPAAALIAAVSSHFFTRLPLFPISLHPTQHRNSRIPLSSDQNLPSVPSGDLGAVCGSGCDLLSPPIGQYPTQPSYPVQSAANPPVYPQTVPLPQPPPYTDAPPAYSEVSRVCFLQK